MKNQDEWEYGVEAAMEDGDVMLQHKPAELLMLIAQVCEVADFSDAVRELLRPLFREKASPAIKALYDSLQKESYRELFALADEALAEEAEHRG